MKKASLGRLFVFAFSKEICYNGLEKSAVNPFLFGVGTAFDTKNEKNSKKACIFRFCMLYFSGIL